MKSLLVPQEFIAPAALIPSWSRLRLRVKGAVFMGRPLFIGAFYRSADLVFLSQAAT